MNSVHFDAQANLHIFDGQADHIAVLGPGGLMAYIERDEMDVPIVRVVRLVALEPAGQVRYVTC